MRTFEIIAPLVVLALALHGAFRHFRLRGGSPRAIGLIALLVLGSGSPFLLLRLSGAESTWWAFGIVVLAMSFAFDREPLPGGEAADVYHGDQKVPLTFLLVPFLLGALVRYSPVAPLFLGPLLAGLPRGRRTASLVAGLAGVALAVAVWVLVPDFRGIAPPVFSLHALDPGVLRWNLTYLAAGRNVGLLVWYLPALLLVGCYRPGTGRGPLLAAAVAATFVLLLWAPHNFWGGPASTNVAFLPIYGHAQPGSGRPEFRSESRARPGWY